MEIKIKTYDESFLIAQTRLVNSIQKKWKPRPFHQTVKDYKESFKSEHYLPKLNLYSFEADELVGLINSRIDGENLSIEPYVKDQKNEILDLLFRTLLENITEDMNINRITIVSGPGRPDHQWVVDHLGFVKMEPRFSSCVVPFHSIKIPTITEHPSIRIVDYDPKKHFEDISTLVHNTLNIPKDAIEHELKEMYKLKSITISWSVALENNEFVGYGLLILDRPNHKHLYLREIFIKNIHNNKNKNEIFNSIYSELISKAKDTTRNFESLTLRVRHQSPYQRLYQNLGYEFVNYFTYQFPLNE